jgi:hypothetical protein
LNRLKSVLNTLTSWPWNEMRFKPTGDQMILIGLATSGILEQLTPKLKTNRIFKRTLIWYDKIWAVTKVGCRSTVLSYGLNGFTLNRLKSVLNTLTSWPWNEMRFKPTGDQNEMILIRLATSGILEQLTPKRKTNRKGLWKSLEPITLQPADLNMECIWNQHELFYIENKFEICCTRLSGLVLYLSNKTISKRIKNQSYFSSVFLESPFFKTWTTRQVRFTMKRRTKYN